MSMHVIVHYNTNKKASLANAKVSARLQCVYEGFKRKKSTTNQRKRKEHNVEK